MSIGYYGLSVGDKVNILTEPLKNKDKVFEVTYLYATDKNAVRLRGEDGSEFDYVAEWCKVINQLDKKVK